MTHDSLDMLSKRRTRPHGRRRIMRDFRLDDISVVDKPAQAGALAVIVKRKDNAMSMYDPPLIRALHKAREDLAALDDMISPKRRRRKQELDTDPLNPRIPPAERRRRERQRAAVESEKADEEDEDEEIFDFEQDEEFQFQDDGDLEEDDTIEMADDLDDEDELPPKRRRRKRELELDPEDDERLRAVQAKAGNHDLDEEIEEAKAEMADEEDDDTEKEDEEPTTEVGQRAAELRERDPRLSKRRALLMASGRTAAKRSIFKARYKAGPAMGREQEEERRELETEIKQLRDEDRMMPREEAEKRALRKMASRISTNSDDPFVSMAPRQEGRRRNMRMSAEQHRRNIDKEVRAIQRDANGKLSNVEALREARKRQPALFR